VAQIVPDWQGCPTETLALQNVPAKHNAGIGLFAMQKLPAGQGIGADTPAGQ
jgi:hypothetical protein